MAVSVDVSNITLLGSGANACRTDGCGTEEDSGRLESHHIIPRRSSGVDSVDLASGAPTKRRQIESYSAASVRAPSRERRAFVSTGLRNAPV